MDRTAALDFSSVVEAIRIAVGREHGVQCSSVTLISPRGIPKTSSGKIQRRACRQALMDGQLKTLYQWSSEPTEQAAQPQELENIAADLAEVWQRVLNLRAIPHDVGFFDLGGTSVLAAEMVADASERWSVDLPLSIMLAADTVETLAAAIHLRRATGLTDVPIIINEKGARPVLFLVSHFSGTTLAARHLARSLGSDQPICVLELITEKKETRVHSVEEAAGLFIGEMRKVQPRGPYRISALSLGCMFAFEVAHQLRLKGEEVVLLAMIDGSPDRPNLWQATVRQVKRMRVGLVDGHARQTLQTLKRRAQWFVDRRVDGAPPASLEAAIRLVYLYRLPSTYDGKIVLMTTAESVRKHGDEALGWRRRVPGGVRTLSISGNHYDLTQEAGVAEVAARLRELLDEVLKSELAPDRLDDPRQLVAT
jgi:thioesterase domain-containing protein